MRPQVKPAADATYTFGELVSTWGRGEPWRTDVPHADSSITVVSKLGLYETLVELCNYKLTVNENRLIRSSGDKYWTSPQSEDLRLLMRCSLRAHPLKGRTLDGDMADEPRSCSEVAADNVVSHWCRTIAHATFCQRKYGAKESTGRTRNALPF